MIAVVFAAMMLQTPEGGSRPRDESAASRVVRQGLMVWIIVLGESMVGLLTIMGPKSKIAGDFRRKLATAFY